MAFKELSIALLPARPPISSGSRATAAFVEECWNRQNLTSGDRWWPSFLRNQKITSLLSSWYLSFRASLAACRYDARRRAKGGGVHTSPPPPPQQAVENAGPAGREFMFVFCFQGSFQYGTHDRHFWSWNGRLWITQTGNNPCLLWVLF